MRSVRLVGLLALTFFACAEPGRSSGAIETSTELEVTVETLDEVTPETQVEAVEPEVEVEVENDEVEAEVEVETDEVEVEVSETEVSPEVETVETTPEVETSDADTTTDVGETEVTACSHDCAFVGASVCDVDGVRTCGQYDDDACLDLSALVACADNEACDDGASVQSCPVSDCDLGEALVCRGTTGYQACSVGADGCPTAGLFASCQPGNTCGAEGCAGGCTTPEIVLLVDRSSSLVGPTWTYVEAAVTGFIEARRDQVKMAVRQFPSESCQADPAPSLRQGAAMTSGLRPPNDVGSTPIAAALTGLEPAFGDPNQAELVVLITDGGESCQDNDAVLTAIEGLRRRGTTVATIAVGTGYDQVLLDTLADRGGSGAARIAGSGASLRAALDALIDDAGACAASTATTLSACTLGQCTFTCAPGSYLSDGQCRAPEVVVDRALTTTQLAMIRAEGERLEVVRRDGSGLWVGELVGTSWNETRVWTNPPTTIKSIGRLGAALSVYLANSDGSEGTMLVRQPEGALTVSDAPQVRDEVATARLAVPSPWGVNHIVHAIQEFDLLPETPDVNFLAIHEIVGAFGSELTGGDVSPPAASFGPNGARFIDALNLTAAGMGRAGNLHVVSQPSAGAPYELVSVDALERLPLGEPIALGGFVPRQMLVDDADNVVLFANQSTVEVQVIGPDPRPLTTVPFPALSGTGANLAAALAPDGRIAMARVSGEQLHVAWEASFGQWTSWSSLAPVTGTPVLAIEFDRAGNLHLVGNIAGREKHLVLRGLAPACAPSCGVQSCGSDGCGGTCGDCGTRGCGDEVQCLPAVTINEVQFASGDVEGFVEIHAPIGTDLSRYALVEVWRNVVYGGANLSGVTTTPYTLVPVGPDQPLYPDPESTLRLYRRATLVDAVSFASGKALWGEGARAANPAAGASVGRRPDGSDTQDNAADFEAMTPTPGAANGP